VEEAKKKTPAKPLKVIRNPYMEDGMAGEKPGRHNICRWGKKFCRGFKMCIVRVRREVFSLL
jgi:hypothetical protein